MRPGTTPNVSFKTSGTTGKPVQWWRTEDQLRLECSVMVSQLGNPDALLSFASPDHMFGDVFGRRIPDYLGVPSTAVSDILQPVNFPDAPRIFIICVPSTWQILARQQGKLRAYKTITFVHSAGPLPRDARNLLASLGRRARLVEIFGSTECGGIALRRGECAEPDKWTLLPDVDLIGPQKTGQLEIFSPRLASRSRTKPVFAFVTDDVVRRTGPRSFAHLGRRDRIIKFDGRRVDLDAIDRQIEAHLCKQVASVPVVDGSRGSSFDVYVEGGDLRDETAIRVKASLQPRAVRLRQELPRTATGKIDYQSLLSESGTETSSMP